MGPIIMMPVPLNELFCRVAAMMRISPVMKMIVPAVRSISAIDFEVCPFVLSCCVWFCVVGCRLGYPDR